LIYCDGFGGERYHAILQIVIVPELLAINYVNDPRVISIQPKMTAINSCIEMDLTGQVCSDSLGCKIYSGFGGQLDFLRGSAKGQDGRGKAIVAFPSVTSTGESKIQPVLKLGKRIQIRTNNRCKILQQTFNNLYELY